MDSSSSSGNDSSDQDSQLSICDQQQCQQDTLRDQNKKRDQKFETKNLLKNRVVDLTLNDHNGDQIISEKLCQQSQMILENLTKHYELTFKDISRSSLLKKAPLNNYEKEEIQSYIRVKRQQLNRKSKPSFQKNQQLSSKSNFNSKVSKDSQLFQDLNQIYKNRYKTCKQENSDYHNNYKRICQLILENYSELNTELKQILNTQLCLILQSNQQLLQKCQEFEINIDEEKLQKQFIHRQLDDIKTSFKRFNQEQIIFIHLKIQKQIIELQNEGQTLYYTLFPYLQQPHSQIQLSKEQTQVYIQMIQSINRHLSDHELTSSSAFIGISIELIPNEVKKNILSNNNNIEQFRRYLKSLQFTDLEIDFISQQPVNFLWPNQLKQIQSINQLYRQEIIALISKVIITQDPNQCIFELLNIFAQRRILLSVLNKKDKIKLPIERISLILSMMKDLDLEVIKDIIIHDDSAWFKILEKHQSKDNKNSILEQDAQFYKDLYEEKTKNFKNQDKVDFKIMIDLSNKLEVTCDQYQHSVYQSIVTACILSNKISIVQVHMPTASGKTWVQGLLSYYWINLGKKVLIIVPNETLKIQTQRCLQMLGIQLQVETIENFYKNKLEYDVIIVDEYDQIVSTKSFYSYEGRIFGLWDLTLTQTYLFSATCHYGIQRLLQSLLGQPSIMTFQSEQELLSGVQQDLGGRIQTCKDQQERLQLIDEELIKVKDLMPIIIFSTQDDMDDIKKIIDKNLIKNLKIGINIQIIDEIETWQKGVLILQPDECIGFNTKFMKDSLVIIACNVESEAQYQQMRGRSSRTRGNFQSLYLPVTNFNKSQIIQGMKRLALQKLDELEKLTTLVYKKRQSKALIDTIKCAQDEQDQVQTLDDLRQLMGNDTFKKLTQSKIK